MVNLENFSRWNLNEGSLFSNFKWVSAPKGLTLIQKSGIEGKISSSGLVFSEDSNFSYTIRYWDGLKTRLTQNSIGFKYGNSSIVPLQWIYWGEKVIYSDQRPLLSKNVEKQKVVAYYPVAYNGAALDKFWVVAFWRNPSGKLYLREMTLKDFLTKTTKSIITDYLDLTGKNEVKIDFYMVQDDRPFIDCPPPGMKIKE